MPDFSLTDVNPNSPTSGQAVSPRDYLEQVSAWYFAHSTCGYCISQFGYMDTMQKELRDAYPTLRIQFLGINENGQESGNASATSGRVLPWLQDVDANSNGRSDVWYDSWNVVFRDVVILDGTNTKVGLYNVTVHSLATPENYAILKEMVVDAAMKSQKPWRNAVEPLDVNNSQTVTALDALIIINRLNVSGAEELPPPTGTQSPPPFYDCNGDNEVAPVDALQIINALNADSMVAAGEGEGSQAVRLLTAAVAGVAAASPLPTELDPSAGVHRIPPATMAPRNAVTPTPDAAWDNLVDLALAATADAGRKTCEPLPGKWASSDLWRRDVLWDIPEEFESLWDGA